MRKFSDGDEGRPEALVATELATSLRYFKQCRPHHIRLKGAAVSVEQPKIHLGIPEQSRYFAGICLPAARKLCIT